MGQKKKHEDSKVKDRQMRDSFDLCNLSLTQVLAKDKF